jgi:crotonobetainyl-CoA:carnitine CoA-transferase CaiB-like acyl-CoA transferase
MKKKSEEWIKIFDKEGLPCGPINSITEMHQDPHTLDRKMVIEVENKTAGKSKAIGMPIKFSDTNSENNKGAPIFGQHTNTVLKDFGYTQEQIEEFKSKGIIA